ncbi:K+ transport system, NAD-binding component [Azospira oryzae PS]|uniref:K+ transport system, NAD-binding component n=1 Tax=Azospira oryzae (strain ATCC BAA-33 / DSM 13638 / PS) TaxID=640081 RepID=G8QFP7_AZOOP|nr:potassium channel family protein [Azospira oryzae]AEV27160.1 K+ transport system, NAD-binding component [Azospira oryzae PS]
MSASTSNQPLQVQRYLYGALIMLVAVHVIGTFGYHLLTGGRYTWFDCFYMTFITVATIGYGEIIEMTQNPAARMFTVFIGILGAGTLSFLFSTVTVTLVESDLNGTLRRRRMEKMIKKLTGHYIVCGFGRVGRNVARELEATNRHFVAIEENLEGLEVQREKSPGLLYLHGDASDDDVLLGAGLESARGVFAVTGDDSRNLMITITVKQLNPAIRVVARCQESRNVEKMKKAGADAIFSPDLTGGMRLASLMVRPHVVSFLDEMLKSEKRLRVEEVAVPGHFPPTPLGNLKLRSNEYVLLAVREKLDWVFNPPKDYELNPGYVIVAMASALGRQELEASLLEMIG